MKNRPPRRLRPGITPRPPFFVRPPRRAAAPSLASPPSRASDDRRLRELLIQATDVLRSQAALLRQSDFCTPFPGGALKGLGHILQNVQDMLVDAYIIYDERLCAPENAETEADGPQEG